MSIDSLTNWNKSIFKYLINNCGTPTTNNTFIFEDVDKPNGCGDVEVVVKLGYPESKELESLNRTTIAISDPYMPETIDIGIAEEADLRVYTIYGYIMNQQEGYNKRLRDRIAEKVRNIFSKGQYIEIIDFEDISMPVIDGAWVDSCDLTILKPTSSSPIDKYRFVCSVSILGYYNKN